MSAECQRIEIRAIGAEVYCVKSANGPYVIRTGTYLRDVTEVKASKTQFHCHLLLESTHIFTILAASTDGGGLCPTVDFP